MSCVSKKGKHLNLERRSSWRTLPIQHLCEINFLSARFLVSLHPLQFQALFLHNTGFLRRRDGDALVVSAERDDGTHFSPCAVVILWVHQWLSLFFKTPTPPIFLSAWGYNMFDCFCQFDVSVSNFLSVLNILLYCGHAQGYYTFFFLFTNSWLFIYRITLSHNLFLSPFL